MTPGMRLSRSQRLTGIGRHNCGAKLLIHEIAFKWRFLGVLRPSKCGGFRGSVPRRGQLYRRAARSRIISGRYRKPPLQDLDFPNPPPSSGGDPGAADAAVGDPVEARGGAAGAEDDIDTEGVVGGVADLVGDGVVADRAGAINAAAPAGVFGVEALGDALREGGGREPGARIAGLGGDLLHDGEAVGRMRDGGAGQGEGAGPQRERGGGRVIHDGGHSREIPHILRVSKPPENAI